MYVHVKDDTVN